MEESRCKVIKAIVFDPDELKEQMKTKSNYDLRAEINELLRYTMDRESLEYHRCFIEEWLSHFFPELYRAYLAGQERKIDYREECKTMLDSIEDSWIMNQVHRYITNMTKEEQEWNS